MKTKVKIMKPKEFDKKYSKRFIVETSKDLNPKKTRIIDEEGNYIPLVFNIKIVIKPHNSLICFTAYCLDHITKNNLKSATMIPIIKYGVIPEYKISGIISELRIIE